MTTFRGTRLCLGTCRASVRELGGLHESFPDTQKPTVVSCDVLCVQLKLGKVNKTEESPAGVKDIVNFAETDTLS